MGVKEDKARAWGWVDNPELTWQEIAQKAASGELKYAMTNPASSNSGFTSLMGVAAAFSGSADALGADDVERVSDDLQAFFAGQALTSGSSGWLAESYVKEQDRLDGIINYESVLLGLNKGRELREKLYLVYPKEGIVTADYPIMLINKDKREAYNRLVEYLLSEDFQRRMMEETVRRPVNPQVKASDEFPSQLLVELPFPNSREVIDQLIFSYLDEQRVPSHAFFVLDVSGSMKGDSLRQLQQAMLNLTGQDTSITGQFARFRDRERITVITFNDEVQGIRQFDVAIDDQATLQPIRDHVESLEAQGGTAIYSALYQAYEMATAARREDPNRYYSIVLMSDGQNRDGISSRQFFRYYDSLPDGVDIRTFPIVFGSADEEAMAEIADKTGGRLFHAKSESLSLVFKQIRGYQ
jgi:Ca-activated chloride channel family protein